MLRVRNLQCYPVLLTASEYFELTIIVLQVNDNKNYAFRTLVLRVLFS